MRLFVILSLISLAASSPTILTFTRSLAVPNQMDAASIPFRYEVGTGRWDYAAWGSMPSITTPGTRLTLFGEPAPTPLAAALTLRRLLQSSSLLPCLDASALLASHTSHVNASNVMLQAISPRSPAVCAEGIVALWLRDLNDVTRRDAEAFLHYALSLPYQSIVIESSERVTLATLTLVQPEEDLALLKSLHADAIHRVVASLTPSMTSPWPRRFVPVAFVHNLESRQHALLTIQVSSFNDKEEEEEGGDEDGVVSIQLTQFLPSALHPLLHTMLISRSNPISPLLPRRINLLPHELLSTLDITLPPLPRDALPVTFSIQLAKLPLGADDFPFDSSRGIEFPGPVITIDEGASDGKGSDGEKPVIASWVYPLPPLLLPLSIPDFTMSYNVLCITGTLVAMMAGRIYAHVRNAKNSTTTSGGSGGSGGGRRRRRRLVMVLLAMMLITYAGWHLDPVFRLSMQRRLDPWLRRYLPSLAAL